MAAFNSPAAVRGNSSTPPKPPKFRHSFWWYLKWFFYTLALVIFCLLVVFLSIGYGIYNQLEKVVPDTRLIQARTKADDTRIYAADGKTLLAVIKGEDRVWKPIDEMKIWRERGGVQQQELRNLLKATLAIEDARFYKHPGMDAKRLAGAAVANFKSGRAAQGGSTITEQLAVNLYQTRTKTVSRRLQAALLALQLERRFSKDEILELYVNEIYYGNGAKGCEAAARLYFDKSADALSVGEAALLAGLPQRPTYYDPFDNFERAKKRQKIVLGEMREKGFISLDQYRAALADESVRDTIEKSATRRRREKRNPEKWRFPYFVSYVKAYLAKQQISEELIRNGGLKIITTIEPKLQEEAEKALLSQLGRLSPGGTLQGALVAIDPWTGHVIAMVGGRDYYDKAHNGEFNRAVQARRQPGSTMKPYIYAAAMEQGYSPTSIVIDSTLRTDGTREVRSGGKEVRNYDRDHHGSLTFLKALGMSNNVAATRVMLKVGVSSVIQKSHLMGIRSPLSPYASLALGASDVSLLEHVSAYGVFATRGLRAEETPIERVETSTGQLLIDHAHPVRGARVMSEDAGNKMWDMLRYVVTDGTGRAANFSRDAIGKTGTTSSNKDVWFMGATKQLVAGVWMGYDKPRSLAHGSAGGKWCAPVWRRFMETATDYWKKRNITANLIEDARLTEQRKRNSKDDMKVVRVRLCDETGLVATSACPNTHVEAYSAASGVPEQTCYVHVGKSNGRVLDGSYTARPQRGDLGYDGATGEGGATRRTDDGEWLDQPAADAAERSGNAERNGNAERGDDRATRESAPADEGVVIHSGDGGRNDEVTIIRPGESSPLPRAERGEAPAGAARDGY